MAARQLLLMVKYYGLMLAGAVIAALVYLMASVCLQQWYGENPVWNIIAIGMATGQLWLFFSSRFIEKPIARYRKLLRAYN